MKRKFVKFISVFLSSTLILSLGTSSIADNNNSIQETNSFAATSEATPFWGTANYSGGTHMFIVEEAFNILYNTKGSGVYTTFNKTVNNHTASTWMKNYAVMIDYWDEKAGLMYQHYYGSGGTVFKSGQVRSGYTNAMDRFINAYNKSISLYKSGNKAAAYESLGESVHFMCDLNAPHHVKPAGNYSSNGLRYSNHDEYEGDVNYWVRTDFNFFKETTAPASTYTFMTSNSLRTIGDTFASNVRNNKNIWTYCDLSYNHFGTSIYDESRYSATYNLLTTSQRATAGLIYRFMKDTGQV